MEKDTYDRKAAGIRIREKRRQLGITMKEAAEKLGRVPTYYADIERGNCGMSVETMIAISRLYHMSLDYLILGKEMCIRDSGRPGKCQIPGMDLVPVRGSDFGRTVHPFRNRGGNRREKAFPPYGGLRSGRELSAVS